MLLPFHTFLSFLFVSEKENNRKEKRDLLHLPFSSPCSSAAFRLLRAGGEGKVMKKKAVLPPGLADVSKVQIFLQLLVVPGT